MLAYAEAGPGLVAVRPAHYADGVLKVGLADGGWRQLHGVTGEPTILLDGWRAEACLEVTSGCRLLLIRHEDGGRDIWVIDETFTVGRNLLTLDATFGLDVDRPVKELASRFMQDLRRNLLLEPSDPAWSMLRRVGPHLLRALAARGAVTPRVSRSDATETVSLSTDTGTIMVSGAEIRRLMTHAPMDNGRRSFPWIIPAAKDGRISIPALAQSGAIDSAYLVDRWQSIEPVYLCTEAQAGLNYYMICRIGRSSLLYFPRDDLLLCADAAELATFSAANIGGQLDAALAALAGNVEGASRTASGVGVYTFGVAHIGHVVWYELSAIDVFISHLALGQPARVFLAKGASGAEVFAPIEELYPESSGYVVRAISDAAVMAEAICASVELVLISGTRILQGPRRRISAAVEGYAQRRGLSRVLLEATSRVRKPWWSRFVGARPVAADCTPADRLIVTFGLRLFNRCPADLVGMYARLARALVERFGPLAVVVDGISGPDEGGAAAAPIYNAARGGKPDPTDCIETDASPEVVAETAWVEQFRAAISDLDINVISCVGKPIKENLYWISQAKFFLAPFGAGVVKPRWIYNIPGLVMLSEVNQTHFNGPELFLDQEIVEPPVAPLYFSESNEVSDLPTDPPRTGPPVRVYWVPHPDDFVVHEDIFFPRVLELVAAHAH